MKKTGSSLVIWFCIIMAGSLLFLPFLGSVSLFDWDEINFAEAAREMIVTGDYLNVQINYQPFWEKPPFFFWLQVLSMKVFGINEFGARFPNALCGILTLIFLFEAGKQMTDRKMGFIWAALYACSFLPFFYFKSGIIDPWFNLFIILGFYFGIKYLASGTHRSVSALLSGSFIGLAVLTKGPVALLLVGLAGLIYLFSTGFQIRLRLAHIVLFLAGLMITGGLWFMLQALDGQAEVIGDFIRYQIRLLKTEDAGHGGFPLYHLIILLLGVFPASVFALTGMRSRNTTGQMEKAWTLASFILLLAVLVVFSIVRTKIVHYSSLAYFPVTWLASRSIYGSVIKAEGYKRITAVLLTVFGILWIGVTVLLVFIMLNKEILLDAVSIKDPFALGNLRADVRWTGWEALISLPLLIALILFMIMRTHWKRFAFIVTGSAVFCFLAIAVIVPKAEGYTQQAAIAFYKEKSAEDCYIHPLGFKSYAHLFYGRKSPPVNPLSYDQDWLLQGDIDKPVYIIFKVTRKAKYREQYPHLKILYEKNGFVFSYRDIPKPMNP